MNNDPYKHRFTSTAKGLSNLILVPVLLVAVLLLSVHIQPIYAEGAKPNASFVSQSVYLPLVTKNWCQRHKPTIFGTQLYGNTSASNKYFVDLVASNASWVRVPFAWGDVEPANTTPDHYNWTNIDSILAAAVDGCYNVVATLESAPNWAATSAYGPIDKVPMSEITEFLSAVAERYDGDGIDDTPRGATVNYWEMYNEPDNIGVPGAPNWGDYGAKYAEMLAAVYPAMKSANPNSKIVFGGLAYDWWEETQGGPFRRTFLDDVLAVGGGANFDVMNFHSYPLFDGNWIAGGGLEGKVGLLAKTNAVRAKLNEFGVSKPVIVTEMGWHNNAPPDSPSSDEIQSRYVVELFTQSFAAGLDFAMWWPLADIGGPYAYNSGLVTNSNPPIRKQSFSIYVYMTKLFSTAKFTRIWSVNETGDPNIEVYEFDDSTQNRNLYVAWLDPLKTTATRQMALTATSVIVRDFFGNAQTVTDAADGAADGKVHVTVAGRPIYLEIAK